MRILRPVYPGRSDPVRRPSGMAGGASIGSPKSMERQKAAEKRTSSPRSSTHPLGKAVSDDGGFGEEWRRILIEYAHMAVSLFRSRCRCRSGAAGLRFYGRARVRRGRRAERTALCASGNPERLTSQDLCGRRECGARAPSRVSRPIPSHEVPQACTATRDLRARCLLDRNRQQSGILTSVDLRG